MDQHTNWIVSQIGSREHYAVPRAFHQRGHLQRFFTDVWVPPRSPLRSVGRLGNRFHTGLPSERVRSFNWSSLLLELRHRLGRSRNAYDWYDEVGRRFALNVNAALTLETLEPPTTAAFLFSTGGLETCQYLKQRGIPVIVDQLDPARLDEQSLRQEIDKFPGWQDSPVNVPESYYQRLAREWHCADLVLVNSQWSKRNLLNEGVSEEKIIVVPLCYEPEPTSAASTPSVKSTGPLTVLWLGQVILRKGIHYLFNAARLMSGQDVRFVVAGRIGISQQAVATKPANVDLLGQIPRSRALHLLASADVFVLPTLSDGFALTQLEAMSYGLPVITTSHCGDVVTDGVDGYITPCQDAEAIAEAIRRLNADRALLNEMKQAARAKSQDPRFSLRGYATAVENALEQWRRRTAPTRPGG